MASYSDTIYQEEIYFLPSPTLIILHQPWSKVTSEERVLLGKILNSVGQRIESVRMVVQPEFNLQDFNPSSRSRVLFFGPPVNGLAQNELITLESSQVILSAPLSQLQSDAAAKQKLWQALKTMFKA